MISPIKAGRKEWIGLAVLLLPLLIISMDMTVLFFAAPFISADLAPTSSQQLWIIDIYGFVLAGLLITMGALGDRIGRRLLLLIGAAAFGLASIGAAYSTSPDMLIAARAIQGMAGATLMPSTLALIRNMFHDAKQRRTAVAIWTAGFSGGAALGPIVSGILLNHFRWGSVFLINVPVMLLLLILGPILLPEFRDPTAGRFDLLSGALSLGAVLPVIYGIQQMAQDGPRPALLLVILGGLLLGAVFVRRQQTVPDPLVDLRLFRVRTFSTAILVNVPAMFAMVGFALFTTQYLQDVLGMRPLTAALWSMPAPLAVGVAAAVSSILARRIRPAYIIAGGLLITALGFAVLTQAAVTSSLAVVLIGATLQAAGIGVALTLTSDLILSAVPPERAGAAAALSETSNELGGALGIAVLGSIGAAVYRHDMAGSAPIGSSPAVRSAAGQTLGGAQSVAGHLPARIGDALVHAAREAFTQGLHAAAIAGAVLMVVAAGLAFITLRHLEAAMPSTQQAATKNVLPGDAAQTLNERSA